MLEVPRTVYTLWIIGLALAVLMLPVVVHLLHRLWRDASHIERYAAESLAAGIGIAGNTQHIAALQLTLHFFAVRNVNNHDAATSTRVAA